MLPRNCLSHTGHIDGGRLTLRGLGTRIELCFIRFFAALGLSDNKQKYPSFLNFNISEDIPIFHAGLVLFFLCPL